MVSQSHLKIIKTMKSKTPLQKHLVGANFLQNLPFAVVDLETTGIDVLNDRIIEVGAISMEGEKILPKKNLNLLINPEVEITQQSQKIHHISQDMVANKKTYKEEHEAIHKFLHNHIIVGFNINFDLAVLRNESKRCGFAQEEYRWLDVRFLAIGLQIIYPETSLEGLAEKLGVTVVDRHRALGDADTTAKIFAKLIPLLKTKKNIRTLAGAELLIQNHLSMLSSSFPDDWYYRSWLAKEAPSEKDKKDEILTDVERIDPYPFHHTIKEVMKTTLISCEKDEPIINAIKKIKEKEIGALIVTDKNDPKNYSLIEERQILYKIAASGGEILQKSILSVFPDVFKRQQLTILQTEYLYQAMEVTQEKKVNHLLVINHLKELVGIVSSRDLMQSRISNFHNLGELTSEAKDGKDLAKSFNALPLIATRLLGERLNAIEISRIISTQIIAMTAKAAKLAEEIMEKEGHGRAPVPFALLILGSCGRRESTLSTDQDNAIVFKEGEEEVQNWFQNYGKIINELLDDGGIDYCDGGVMARNKQWCQSLKQWKKTIHHWHNATNGESILQADIFYDCDFVYGDQDLYYSLKSFAYESSKEAIDFLKLIGNSITENLSSALKWWGFSLTTEKNRFDVKKNVLFPIVATARLLAMRAGYYERASTLARIRGSQKLIKKLPLGDLLRMEKIYETSINLILNQQLYDLKAGKTPSKSILVSSLSKEEEKFLRKSMSYLNNIDDFIQIALVNN